MRGNTKKNDFPSKVRSGDDAESTSGGTLTPKELAFALSEFARGVRPVIVKPTFINCTHTVASEEPVGVALKLFLGE